MIKITFTRRFIVAVCLLSMVVMVYLLAFYDPLAASQRGLEKELSTLQAKRGSIPAKPRMQQEAERLKASIAELERAIEEHPLSKKPKRPEIALKKIIDGLYNETAREAVFTSPLRFCEDLDEIPASMAKAWDREDGCVCFKFQGELDAVYGFIRRVERIGCTPRAWIIESLENPYLAAPLFNLWMEIEP